MTKQDDTAAILNSLVKIRIQSSKIHGVGVFAMRDIAKGQKLYADILPQPYKLPYKSFNKLFPEVRDLLLERWPQIVNGSQFAWPDTYIQAYCNHDTDPNYDATKDILLKDVEKGEEITEDYREIKGWEIVFPWLVK